MKKIYLETFGCQMNVLDSELVETQLRAIGYDFTSSLADADVVLYNTCSVRDRSEQKVWSRLGALKERKIADPSLIIGVIGCMAERDGISLMRRMPQVDLMCGPSQLDQLPTLLENVLKTSRQQHALAGNTARRSQTKKIEQAQDSEDRLERLDLSRSFSADRNKFQAYLRIVRGCNKFCSYCVVPFTRGPEISRSPQTILDEAKKLTDAGALEITLLGQTVNHYKHERTTFAELLHLLHEKLPHLPRLRFITSYPADFGDDILHVMAASPRICRYLHIPAQSGSNRILKLMNRGYSVESYLDLLTRARSILPKDGGGIQFASDFIVGFPTETDEDYALTRSLVEQAQYKNSFIFQYSPRPGTLAAKRYQDDIPDSVKRFRNNDLLALQNSISHTLNNQLIGQTVEVLVEAPSGWNSKESDTPLIAGDQREGKIELGLRLAAALHPQKTRGIGAPPMSTHPIQLTARTQHDQIVVFNGPTTLIGQILPVTIQSAHNLTLFATLLPSI
ncbi:MAG: tRNA (N6-isopentenyl adenosine(37)-C2)-methylthiotransferase MiaB [Phycisphaerales bacterium]|nr:tRNA (N6-isopentenyl adenosine(37)-C2)-methylthiotransferase MiaB [Phycisphaerales bacterium]